MTHQATVAPIVRTYYGADAHPVIAQYFKPATGWKRLPYIKRISEHAIRQLHQDGVTAVALTRDWDRRRVADFQTGELLRSYRKGRQP